MTKRLFDVVVSLAVLMLLSPVLVIASLLVVLDSPGPVLYRAKRVGKNGRLFEILKLRTMVVDAENVGPLVTSADDARVTRVGRLLRKWKVDELPQFVNVLRGEMSVVGPRPEAPQYVRLYSEEEKHVLTVQPGVTGISQVLFRNEEAMLRSDDVERVYTDVVMRQKLALDLDYARHHSVGIDAVLVVITAIAVAWPAAGRWLAWHFARSVWAHDMPPIGGPLAAP